MCIKYLLLFKNNILLKITKGVNNYNIVQNLILRLKCKKFFVIIYSHS